MRLPIGALPCRHGVLKEDADHPLYNKESAFEMLVEGIESCLKEERRVSPVYFLGETNQGPHDILLVNVSDVLDRDNCMSNIIHGIHTMANDVQPMRWALAAEISYKGFKRTGGAPIEEGPGVLLVYAERDSRDDKAGRIFSKVLKIKLDSEGNKALDLTVDDKLEGLLLQESWAGSFAVNLFEDADEA